jgi:uncharacterized protein with von Willebrand factor type A (vWA) domain
MRGALVDNIVRFGHALRQCGLEGPAGRMPDAIDAVDLAGVRSRTDVRAALRAVLVHRREDFALFDRVFDLFWKARHERYDGPPLLALGERPRVSAPPTGSAAFDFDEPDAARQSGMFNLAAGAYSTLDVPRHKDFAEFTPEEMARAEVLFDRLSWRLGVRRSRRWRRGTRGSIDLRRTLSRNARLDGEIVELPRRTRVLKPRPLVVLADVSGSMERYSRILLQFVYALGRGSHRVESFVFATRLTRVTRAAARRGGARSVDALVRSVVDWGGGTRIGEALRAFNVNWARRVMRNGPVVLLISDGWDRGEPAALARELARVRRSSKRLIWLNPLLGSASYEPLTRGMQAALPLVDDFMPVHNLASLETLAEHLQRLERP